MNGKTKKKALRSQYNAKFTEMQEKSAKLYKMHDNEPDYWNYFHYVKHLNSDIMKIASEIRANDFEEEMDQRDQFMAKLDQVNQNFNRLNYDYTCHLSLLTKLLEIDTQTKKHLRPWVKRLLSFFVI